MPYRIENIPAGNGVFYDWLTHFLGIVFAAAFHIEDERVVRHGKIIVERQFQEGIRTHNAAKLPVIAYLARIRCGTNQSRLS